MFYYSVIFSCLSLLFHLCFFSTEGMIMHYFHRGNASEINNFMMQTVGITIYLIVLLILQVILFLEESLYAFIFLLFWNSQSCLCNMVRSYTYHQFDFDPKAKKYAILLSKPIDYSTFLFGISSAIIVFLMAYSLIDAHLTEV